MGSILKKVFDSEARHQTRTQINLLPCFSFLLPGNIYFYSHLIFLGVRNSY